jgi:hypothetical protein
MHIYGRLEVKFQNEFLCQIKVFYSFKEFSNKISHICREIFIGQFQINKFYGQFQIEIMTIFFKADLKIFSFT